MISFGQGEEVGKENWNFVVTKLNRPSLEAFCRDKKISSTAREPAVLEQAPFSRDNPVFCSATLEEAQHSYGLYEQTKAKEASIKLTFQFIGVWLCILLILFAVSKVLNRRKQKE